MTDEHRRDDRRAEDMRLAQAVTDLQTSIEERLDHEWARAAEIHAGLAPRVHDHPEIALLVDALEGSPKMMPSGSIVREGGLIAEVAAVNRKLNNGGVRIKIPAAVWVAIVVAILTGLFNIWAAVIQAGAVAP